MRCLPSDKLRALLINPWIHDFSALNLWSAPLGLLKVAEFLSQFDCKISYIDCLDTIKPKSYGTGKYRRQPIQKPLVLRQIPRKFCRYGITIEEFQFRLKSIMPVDIILVTSIMTYWYTGVAETIDHIKKIYGDVPVILGGIYATLCPDHANMYSGADLIYEGSIETRSERSKSNGLEAVIRNFGLRLTNITDKKAYYKLGLINWQFTPLLTASGCIFSCTYCASRLLNKDFIRKTPDEVFNEIEEFYKLGIRDFAFYDDALLTDSEDHLKPILKKVIQKGLPVRFHAPNGIHVRFIDNELAMLMKASGFKTLRLSLETVSPARQKLTGSKVKTDEFVNAVTLLKKSGFTKNEFGVYLMYGLPGQSLDEVKEGVKFLKSLHVNINLTEFSPIPNTKMWNELLAKGIISKDIDLLLTNNSVYYYLYSGYDLKELEKLKLEVKAYNSS
ncbi:MAG: radical SAM protein [Nitrospinae bacterium]|nr:radical SAM protein [Nitrospinota bacterium]